MRLERIFEQQEKLYHTFGPVVENNGFHHTTLPCDVDDPQNQAQVKLTIYAFMEELGEALEAALQGNHKDAQGELIDALHFLVETFILLDLSPDDLLPELQQPLKFTKPHLDLLDTLYVYANASMPEGPDAWPSSLMLHTMFLATMMGHRLKNKPWKQSRRETDLEELKSIAQGLMLAFIRLCMSSNLSPQKLYDQYFVKHKENNERVASGY